MCWSLEVSAGSWAVVMALGAFLLKRSYANDRWLACFLMFVGQVQLLEALLWLDQGCTGLNQTASKALLAVISSEPLVHALIALACTPAAQRTAVQRAMPVVSAAFATVFAAHCVSGTQSWCCLPCGGGACGRHLKWGWASTLTPAWHVAFLALLAAPFLALQPGYYAAAVCAYALATFAGARVLFHPGGFESMWCWLAVGAYAIPLALGRPLPGSAGRAHKAARSA